MDKQILVRDIDYKSHLEGFLISALIAILGIRVFLEITNYPVIGLKGFHISHMLWGGMLMSLSIFMLIFFLNGSTKKIAVVVGGIGFGTFIDELGKFITRDNNYFYQPTIALIYLLFISFYLIFHFFHKRHEFTKKEYLVNSVELLKEAIINDLDEEEKKRAIAYLEKSGNEDDIAHTLASAYQKINAIPMSAPSIISKIKISLKKLYLSLVHTSGFKVGVMTFFLFQAILAVLIAVLTIFERRLSILPLLLLPSAFSVRSYNTVQLYTSILSFGLILIGIFRIYHSRISAFQMFKRAVLLSIFISHVMAFYYKPLNAFISLIFHVFILVSLNYMIESEKNMQKKNS